MDSNKIRLPGWEIGKELGKGGFGSVYEIRRDVFGKVETNALKVISIPNEPGMIEFMRMTGMSDRDIAEKLQGHVKNFLSEYSIMLELRDNPHIVHCYDFQHSTSSNGLEWTILIRMELLTPLLKAMDKVSTEDQILQLGLDMCDALIACQSHKIIHRDIKPQNVFVAASGAFKLGDFGISKMLEDATQANTQAGTLMFMAPEIAAGKRYNSTVDIYSLGLMLYWLLNHRRGPFLPLPPQSPGFQQDQEALSRRMRGDSFNPPANGSPALKRVVMKACSFDPANRFRNAREMQDALLAVRESASGSSAANQVSNKHNHSTVINKSGSNSRGGDTYAGGDTVTLDGPMAHTYVMCSACYTGYNSYRYYRDLQETAVATLSTDGSYTSFTIEGAKLHLSNHEPYSPHFTPPQRELRDAAGQLVASIPGFKNDKGTICYRNKNYQTIRQKNGWCVQDGGKTFLTIYDIDEDAPWSPVQRQVYFDPVRDSSPCYLMKATTELTDEQLMVFLSYPLLAYAAASDPVVPEKKPATTQKVFYLDENHNFVPEEDAVYRVIQVLDEKGNMIDEIWQTSEKALQKKQEESTPEITAPLPDLMNYRGRTVEITSVNQSLESFNIQATEDLIRTHDSIIVSLARQIQTAVGKISMFGAAELLHYRMVEYDFPWSYEEDISQFRSTHIRNMSLNSPANCTVVTLGRFDLGSFRKELLLADHDDASTQNVLLQKLMQIIPGLNISDAETLAVRILATGFVPEYFNAPSLCEYLPNHSGASVPNTGSQVKQTAERVDFGQQAKKTGNQPEFGNQHKKIADMDKYKDPFKKTPGATDRKDVTDQKAGPGDDSGSHDFVGNAPNSLDVRGTLDLKWQPGSNKRKHVVDCGDRQVKLTLPRNIPIPGKEYTVKGAGLTDQATGKTGDAHIQVNCNTIFASWTSLLNILWNLFVCIAMVVMAVFTVVKALLTSKVFWLLAVAASVGATVYHFFLR